MALSRIKSESVNLADDFAFTGTVTGIDSGGFTQGTKVSPTSGTTVDFTGIPSDVKIIHVLFNELDMSAAGWSVVQLGDSGGFETTGYTSSVAYPGSGNSYYANPATDNNGCKFWYQGTTKHSGFVTIMRMSTDQTQWVMWSRCHAAEGSTYSSYSAVEKTLSADLTQIRITQASASFVSGDINILYSS